MKEILTAARRSNFLVSLCLNKVIWDKRIVGYIEAIIGNVIKLNEVDEFGDIVKKKNVSIDKIVSVEINDNYSKGLEELKREGKRIKKLKASFYYNRGHRFVEKVMQLKLEGSLCTIFFNNEYVTGVVDIIGKDHIRINNIGYLGKDDGQSIYKINIITKIRFNGPEEGKISFLREMYLSKSIGTNNVR